MTMKEMVQEFERRGFTVEKGYSPIKIGYDFTISKDGHSVSDFFPYPENKPNNVKHGLQVDFIDDLVKKFNSTICGDDVKHSMVHDALTSLRYTNGEGILSVAGYESMPVRITDLRSELRPFDRCPHISIEADVLFDLDNDKERMRGVTAAITKVEFNGPATIVFWTDGTKTVVKAQNNEVFDPEKGLAMAIVKKAYGNKGNYCNQIKKWLPYNTPRLVDLGSCKLHDAYKTLVKASILNKPLKADYERAIEEALEYLEQVFGDEE